MRLRRSSFVCVTDGLKLFPGMMECMERCGYLMKLNAYHLREHKRRYFKILEGKKSVCLNIIKKVAHGKDIIRGVKNYQFRTRKRVRSTLCLRRSMRIMTGVTIGRLMCGAGQ